MTRQEFISKLALLNDNEFEHLIKIYQKGGIFISDDDFVIGALKKATTRYNSDGSYFTKEQWDEYDPLSIYDLLLNGENGVSKMRPDEIISYGIEGSYGLNFLNYLNSSHKEAVDLYVQSTPYKYKLLLNEFSNLGTPVKAIGVSGLEQPEYKEDLGYYYYNPNDESQLEALRKLISSNVQKFQEGGVIESDDPINNWREILSPYLETYALIYNKSHNTLYTANDLLDLIEKEGGVRYGDTRETSAGMVASRNAPGVFGGITLNKKALELHPDKFNTVLGHEASHLLRRILLRGTGNGNYQEFSDVIDPFVSNPNFTDTPEMFAVNTHIRNTLQDLYKDLPIDLVILNISDEDLINVINTLADSGYTRGHNWTPEELKALRHSMLNVADNSTNLSSVLSAKNGALLPKYLGGGSWAGVAQAGMDALGSIMNTATKKNEKKLTTPIQTTNPWTNTSTPTILLLEVPTYNNPQSNVNIPIIQNTNNLGIDWEKAKLNPMTQPPLGEENLWDAVYGPESIVYWRNKQNGEYRLKIASLEIKKDESKDESKVTKDETLNVDLTTVLEQLAENLQGALNVPVIPLEQQGNTSINGNPLALTNGILNNGMQPPVIKKQQGGSLLNEYIQNNLSLNDYLKLTATLDTVEVYGLGGWFKNLFSRSATKSAMLGLQNKEQQIQEFELAPYENVESNKKEGTLKTVKINKSGGTILDLLKDLLPDSEIIDLLQHFGIDELMEEGIKNTGKTSISITIMSSMEEPDDGGHKAPELKKIEVNDKIYEVEVVTSEADMEKGLGERKSLGENKGMLFDFQETQHEVVFNTEEMKFNIDIIFINKNEEVIKVYQECHPGSELFEANNVRYVLEVNANSGIKEGDEVDLNPEEEVPVMKVLAPDGSTLMELLGGERIFSRKNTKSLIKWAKRCELSQKDSDFKHLGNLMFKFIKTLDTNEPEYVTVPEN